MDGGNVGGRISPEEGHRRNAFLQTGVQLFIRWPVEDEVDAEGAIGELADLADHLPDSRRVSPGDREHPQPTGVGDGSH